MRISEKQLLTLFQVLQDTILGHSTAGGATSCHSILSTTIDQRKELRDEILNQQDEEIR